ncbi:type II toxin-antitoxin system RatA family toxin [Glycomyces salinus]|uniref:type II toxin-antitoxin system RatA family toxin n=1 Tax=Glycomyces salinus TaxID=980294 RepID=UPI0018ED3312|nr:SRPBCC family protein [Glycomyces salinus]
MPQVEARRVVEAPIEVAFAVSQTTGAVRTRWDPFIRSQSLLDGAAGPGKGVRTLTRHRLGWRMVSEYVSYRPPGNVGMTMVSGPWFFRVFGGGWRFTAETPDRTVAVWKYTFTCRPDFLRPVAEPVGLWLLRRDIERRIDAFARACADPEIVAAAS